MKLKKKFIAGALAAGLVMGAAGIAAAYLGATGTGSGSATVGTAKTLIVSSPAVTVVPNGTQTLSFVVTNPNGFKVKFSGATATLTQSTATCGYAITAGPSPTSGTLTKSGTLGDTTTITVTVHMATTVITQGSCTATVSLSV